MIYDSFAFIARCFPKVCEGCVALMTSSRLRPRRQMYSVRFSEFRRVSSLNGTLYIAGSANPRRQRRRFALELKRLALHLVLPAGMSFFMPSIRFMTITMSIKIEILASTNNFDGFMNYSKMIHECFSEIENFTKKFPFDRVDGSFD